jgi:Family of unknown function (DUF6188)
MARVAAVTAKVVESNNHWILPLEEKEITGCCMDFAVTLIIQDGMTLKLEEPFNLHLEGVINRIVPGEIATLGPVLTLWRRTIRRATSTKYGDLRIEFADGDSIESAHGELYEAWTLAGGDGLLVTSLPGGDVSIWDPKQ